MRDTPGMGSQLVHARRRGRGVKRTGLKIDFPDDCPRRSHAALFVDHDDAEPPLPHSASDHSPQTTPAPPHIVNSLSGAIRAADAALDDDLGLG